MTLTITPENLDDVPHVVEWCLRNRDVFGMLSFQPVAHVGRTQEGLPPVTVSELWDRIAELASEKGQERLSACLFRVPVADEMVPMCRVNAGGVRDAVYARLTHEAVSSRP